MECFDFDHSNEIAAARARLSLLIQPETVLHEDGADETSLDDSVRTFRISSVS
jgi:hypothetical protein